MDIRQLREEVDRLFGQRSQFMLLCQEIADNFYPERATFTTRQVVGENFADNLTTSYPLLCRRDLGDQISTMLRPEAKQWMHMTTADPDRLDNDSKRWLEWATGVQRRAMYDQVALFERSAKEEDHDYAAFGQSVSSVRLNKTANALLYRTWHIRDVVWMENEEGGMGLIGRRWKPGARQLRRLFGGAVHREVSQLADRKPFDEIDCYHIVLDADMYDGDAHGKPRWSIYYDRAHEYIMEAVPVWNQEYNISRWQTVSGSQYAYSPATIAALPDARLIQAMTYTLLEAGEKAVNPPMVATQDAVHSDIGVYAGGVTWVDLEYDERLGQALRPLTQDIRGIPLGADMLRDSRSMIHQAFFLNRLTMPERAPEMTAYEVGQRVQEYIRAALPLFAPMEAERNGRLCKTTFDLLLRAGAFGPPQNMPRNLQGAEVQFRFESPLHDLIDAQKGQKLMQAKAMLADVIDVDPSTRFDMDIRTAFRDAMDGVGIPAKWMTGREDADRAAEEAAQQQQAQQAIAATVQGSQGVANLAAAQKDMAAANG